MQFMPFILLILLYLYIKQISITYIGTSEIFVYDYMHADKIDIAPIVR